MLTLRPVDLCMKTSALVATAVVPAALFLAAGVGADPGNNDEGPAPVVEEASPCCVETVAEAGSAPPPEELPPPDELPPPEELPPPDDAPPADEPAPWPSEVVPAANVDMPPHALPPGIASEHGMQVKTILVSRSISEAFPQIHDMIGVRPDSQRWHPNGLALDVMIPNPGSPDGVALGDQIVAYALSNAGRFALQDAIWRGTYYTPGGPSGGGYGHYDHVHITTMGAGYPNGGEEYLSEDGPPPAPEEQT
ncbi:MAG TPA: hypothetical protein VF299_12120 [Mycobacterium sp.]